MSNLFELKYQLEVIYLHVFFRVVDLNMQIVPIPSQLPNVSFGTQDELPLWLYIVWACDLDHLVPRGSRSSHARFNHNFTCPIATGVLA